MVVAIVRVTGTMIVIGTIVSSTLSRDSLVNVTVTVTVTVTAQATEIVTVRETVIQRSRNPTP